MSRYLAVDSVNLSAREVPGLHRTVFGHRTLLWADDGGGREGTAPAVPSVGTEFRQTQGALYLVVQSGESFREDFPQARIALDGGRYLAVDLTDTEAAALAGVEQCYGLVPLPADTAVVTRRDPNPALLRTDPAEAALAAEVSEAGLAAILGTLAGYSTRHTSQPEYQTAADWAMAQLQAMGLAVVQMPVAVGSGQCVNVIADKPGAAAERRLVLVTAHLDSINHRDGPAAPAPGADDNGSGCAGVLEIARVLAGLTLQHDLRLVLFGGEEQGLFGSKALVAAMERDDRQRLAGVINMDMVGTANGTAGPTVMIEGSHVSVPLMDALTAAAHSYTGLTVETSLHPFASDHVPFIDAGLPAVLTIEGSDSANHNIHTANDTLDKISFALAAEIVRMNLVAAARLLGADTGGTSGSDADCVSR